MKKHSDIYQSRIMNPICEQAGCNDDLASKHAWKWEQKRWHAHPSMAFTKWWTPVDFDEVSGAHIGGHPNAYRKWARKTDDGWRHKHYGVSVGDAWNSACYVEEFDAWQSAGSPEQSEPFTSVAVSIERHKEFWRGLRSTLAKIGKKMPKPTPMDNESTEFQPY